MKENICTLDHVDSYRVEANKQLDAKRKKELGQFFTSAPICLFMSSLFHKIEGDVYLLDPGCGPGSLTASFVDEAIYRKSVQSCNIDAFDIDPTLEEVITKSLSMCKFQGAGAGIKIQTKFSLCDYVMQSSLENRNLFCVPKYTHCIMNPPYKKILATSQHKKALRAVGIETGNLYSAFIALAIQQLIEGGELVAIIPRSFCNGPYYKDFRKFILQHTAIQQIHIFDSRSALFSTDEVLQENIILHLIKGKQQGKVIISSSPTADFFDSTSSNNRIITATDMTTREVDFNDVIMPNDPDKFFHIVANDYDQKIVNHLSSFVSSLDDLDVQVSTGPVVDFRLTEDLRQNIETNSVPLIYPSHLNGKFDWPKKMKKSNAIAISDRSISVLWKNQGCYVLINRLSSKDESKRIVATMYDGSLPYDLIGFDNKLNVIHKNKQGIDYDLAMGLYVYLNSTLLDKYYRLFGGHTQVNATDLRSLHYPSSKQLRNMGLRAKGMQQLSQEEIDDLVEKEIVIMGGDGSNPLNLQLKIDQAIEILKLLGMPVAQQNHRSALTFLALLNLHPDGQWSELEQPLLGVTPIMDWIRDIYGKQYAPNTRETIRRQTLHQFESGGLVLYNPDEPNRPVNSPKACYQIPDELLQVLQSYGSPLWEKNLSTWLSQRTTLVEQYAMEREMEKIPLVLSDGTEVKLSPGEHSQLIHDIVVKFGPAFTPGAEVIYLGDTGAKEDFFKKERLKKLGVTVNRKGKLPDVVLYWPEKDWLILIESVTSHGPVDGKRHEELSRLFSNALPGLVYVTAFPNRKIMGRYLSDISWETEVWVADAPTHMIHFNGVRFLGPYD
ncbi:N-6 DNA methylase [Wohlfahrtiimonas chitiniclastica]|uniref:BsuBI/PstI family type II restriction endonuclease n=1 Tax=Wohlfahrtiimonas chitiniclastica TaxID=400946 RepID=UPI001BCFCFEC|nr:BsuBI/PstI family type II restriction endonuclease [Wohlfahrtiimonas chitiniclastica]MBS7829184.1 N-6 DNA methylase [Wohlfahrtiimonas chitiniclastica]